MTRKFQNDYEWSSMTPIFSRLGINVKNMAFTEICSILSYFHVLITVTNKKTTNENELTHRLLRKIFIKNKTLVNYTLGKINKLKNLSPDYFLKKEGSCHRKMSITHNPQNCFHITNECLVSGISSNFNEMLKKWRNIQMLIKVILIFLLHYLTHWS